MADRGVRAGWRKHPPPPRSSGFAPESETGQARWLPEDERNVVKLPGLNLPACQPTLQAHEEYSHTRPCQPAAIFANEFGEIVPPRVIVAPPHTRLNAAPPESKTFMVSSSR